ncbi:SDR family NAD(P)-dependent oxidoreductase [Streptosporangium sp. NPDC000396]|uniref:SDR family NAD(P)-dependent oxidoreductase n=1 Tax=Streptosporangium sp. NPDC000396 TaxID=3366185 RepID=UPI00369B0CC0
MASSGWTEADVPDQEGRVAVITGASSGIGLETARVLAARGASVVIACRDEGKAARAADRIGADVEVLRLDLASIASVRQAAEELRGRHDRLDLLINNAGVMVPPLTRTADGFELQFGTNHLGHFAFTGLLLDRLLPVPGSRIVTVSSLGHRRGRIDFADLRSERSYNRVAAYGRSKLANLLFTYELQRRLAAAGAETIALAAHPGMSSTELTRHLPGALRVLSDTVGSLVLQSPEMGALPTLRAAVDPAARGGEYYGPSGAGELRGHPRRVRSSGRSHDTATQSRLWAESERLTGVAYPL